jgi:carbon monoxide dehydrogenase subunit G
MSMELDNVFTVPASPAQAWEVLLDVERIAPCMPGATVEEFDGEVVTGRIKVKVGPVSLTYRGTAKFIERDPEAQVVVLEAAGKETRGAGTASATVRASLEPQASGDSTRVVIHTTMNVTGRPAQFGRGVIAEVGGKLVEKFADNLAQLISDSNGPSAGSADASAPPAEAEAGAVAAAGGAAAAETGSGVSPAAVTPDAVTPAAARPTVGTAAPKGDDSLNLVRLVGPAILKRVVPVAAAIAALALLGRRFRHLLRRDARKG